MQLGTAVDSPYCMQRVCGVAVDAGAEIRIIRSLGDSRQAVR